MNAFVSLLKIQLKGIFLSSSGGRNSRKKTFTGVGMISVLVLASLYMGVFYSWSMAMVFTQFGILDLLLVFMSIFAAFFSVIFSSSAVVGFLFKGKDNDLLMSLPISTYRLSLAKLLALYLENLALTSLIMGPSVFIYMSHAKTPIYYLPVILVGMIFIPLLSTSLCLILGFMLSFIQSRLRHSAIITNLLYMLSFALILWGNINFQRLLNNRILETLDFRGPLQTYAFPFYWLRNAAIDGNILHLFYFMLFCAVPFFAFAWIFSRFYKGFFSRLQNHKSSTHFQLRSMQRRSAIKALLERELRRYFGIPIYFFNTAFGLVGLLGFSVYLLFKPDLIYNLAGSLYYPLWVLITAMMILAAFTSMSTNVSISLEGDRLWILKESPLSTSTIFMAKALMQILVTMTAVVLALLMLWFKFSLPLYSIPLVLILSFLSSSLSAMLGLIVNLYFPKLDASNDTVVVKQSMSALLGTLLGLLIVALIFFPFMQLKAFNLATGILIVGTLLLILNILCLLFLRSKGNKLFLELGE